MDRRQLLKNHPELLSLYDRLTRLTDILGYGFQEQLERLPAFGDIYVDRWKRAAALGFGEGSNIYDNSLVIGKVSVGRNCWIGPDTILDGSGGLSIGDSCTISAGVHIYSHDNVKQTISGGRLPIERNAVQIGDQVYIAPKAVVTKGVAIGSGSVIGAFAFVNRHIPANTVAIGQPARVVGQIVWNGDDFNIAYNK